VFPLALAACGSSADPPQTTNGNGNGNGNGNPTEDSGTNTGNQTGPLKFKTHVILGDSISDKGGEGPFYYDLLDANDDAKYPESKGLDLKTKYGDIVVLKRSKAGSRAENVAAAVHALPTALEGPVLVTVTVGGNDAQKAIGNVIVSGFKKDGSEERADFIQFIDQSLAELTTPDRFGAGVKVKVLLTNIYDPSDGNGNFTYSKTGEKCPAPLSFYPAGRETRPLLDPWQAELTTTAAKYPDVTLLPLRQTFEGHGVAAAETWFVGDCIHPNAIGHDVVRDLFWAAVEKL
jgi:lysophospholipase L1-like esterase